MLPGGQGREQLGDAHFIGLGPDQADIRTLFGEAQHMLPGPEADFQPDFFYSVRKRRPEIASGSERQLW